MPALIVPLRKKINEAQTLDCEKLFGSDRLQQVNTKTSTKKIILVSVIAILYILYYFTIFIELLRVFASGNQQMEESPGSIDENDIFTSWSTSDFIKAFIWSNLEILFSIGIIIGIAMNVLWLLWPWLCLNIFSVILLVVVISLDTTGNHEYLVYNLLHGCAQAVSLWIVYKQFN
ncbi:uncharacterized protein LOC109609495 [Aethina tumida]|uniref:uncharacterized protein LOC109609495 n=1 Tax=Aethina tumida TaxID=116153 RepID=UPI002147E9C5|nr:uncharacterized protein LOC109609495 [Aethina tumida]